MVYRILGIIAYTSKLVRKAYQVWSHQVWALWRHLCETGLRGIVLDFTPVMKKVAFGLAALSEA